MNAYKKYKAIAIALMAISIVCVMAIAILAIIEEYRFYEISACMNAKIAIAKVAMFVCMIASTFGSLKMWDICLSTKERK